MEDSEELVCWASPNVFSIGIRVRTFAGQLHSENEEAVCLDTGYEGELLVPYDLYHRLNLRLWEYPRRYWAEGVTVSGEILDLILSQGYVVIPRLNIVQEVLIDTFVGNDEFLLGREFIKRFKVLLDGPENRTCLIITSQR